MAPASAIPSPAIDNHYRFAGHYGCYLSGIGSWALCLVVCVLSIGLIVIRLSVFVFGVRWGRLVFGGVCVSWYA